MGMSGRFPGLSGEVSPGFVKGGFTEVDGGVVVVVTAAVEVVTTEVDNGFSGLFAEVVP